MKKGLIATFMVALMLITVLSAVVTASNISHVNKNVEHPYTENSRETMENFNCFVYAKSTWEAFFTKDGEHLFHIGFRLFLQPTDVTFAVHQYELHPSSGFVFTNGDEGKQYFESTSFFGALGFHLWGILELNTYYTGIEGFRGIAIGFAGDSPCYIYGIADHVKVTTNWP